MLAAVSAGEMHLMMVSIVDHFVLPPDCTIQSDMGELFLGDMDCTTGLYSSFGHQSFVVFCCCLFSFMFFHFNVSQEVLFVGFYSLDLGRTAERSLAEMLLAEASLEVSERIRLNLEDFSMVCVVSYYFIQILCFSFTATIDVNSLVTNPLFGVSGMYHRDSTHHPQILYR